MRRRTKKNLFFWVTVILAVVGLAVRLPYVASRSLWFDEAFSWRLIQFPFGEFLERAAMDVHPILYYVVLWIWMLPARTFGPEGTLVWMRLLSVFLGATTVAAMVVAGRVLFRSLWIGVVAGLFTAVNAFQLQYAWEARMYTLGTLLFPFALAALVRVVEARTRGGARRAGLRLGLTLAAFLHVHYYALFSWVAVGAAKLFAFAPRMFKDFKATLRSPSFRWSEAGFWLSALLFLPWLSVFLTQAARVEAAFWIPQMTALAIPKTIARLFWGGTGEVSPVWAVLATVVALLLVGVALWRGRSRSDLIAVSAFVIPVGLSALVSLRTSVFLDRYFLFASLGLLLVVARVLSFLPRAPRRAATLLVAALGFVSVLQFWNQLDFRGHPGARAAANFLRANVLPSEPILVSSSFVYFPMAFHLGCRMPDARCQNGLIVHLYSETGELLHFAGGPILVPGDVIGPAVFPDRGPRANDPTRIWVVDTTGFGGSELAVPAPYTRVHEERFAELLDYQGDVIVREYAREKRAAGARTGSIGTLCSAFQAG